VQQKWRKSLVAELRKKAEEHCGKGILEETQLLELGWCTREVIVTLWEGLRVLVGEWSSDLE